MPEDVKHLKEDKSKGKVHYTEVVDIGTRRKCIKYGKFFSGSQRPRWFVLDAQSDFYKYYREENATEDVKERRMKLSTGEYTIQKKVQATLME